MRISLIISLLFFAILIAIGCRSNKNIPSRTAYLLELPNEMAVKELNSNYVKFDISDIQRSSRSEFFYSVTFSCEDESCKEVESTLDQDQSILTFSRITTHVDTISTSTSSKAHRTGPLGGQK